ncbi:chromosome partitioning protein ParA [Leptospira biflexa]|jgi:chromosome partitioning protein|uniref:Putative ATPase, ParA family n=1 Tax=Leptospira biflexa serovar Patoc (strain Patoc 1 / ATCC 23582 / Paris) TaxID=456481 RepID=B0STM9_LEPBP|nr:ParA family protein [Leptospira biflexa]ABZ95849.1 ParA-like protein [Leptospira biflexa serovar Patoc strain 'Patoc 1 (Ames)']ABZ99563.1 Putative ATPase, ParA family [Leptospira biflexa serovar Patoc strain 'Patoc 1 (Paris)']TGM32043.1 chromosome partitioning protein ParA [Leptospira biflexa]TGM38988.1 chromosome partitioning protein ParA [Leptospira biflexa]TGM42791.1 chromosome partitioning protein ParA [Leptospira biflexa]
MGNFDTIFDLEEAAKFVGLDLEDFQNRVSNLKVPGWKTGEFKQSILLKYFESSNMEGFDSSVIAVSNQKGGEGKTTISLYLAEALSENHKVLLIDWDPQANATHLFLRDEIPSIMDYLGYRGKKSKNIEPIIRNISNNFDLLPSNLELANLTTPYERDDFELLKEAILPLRSRYEYIIIDCPPSLGLILENALICADYILVPIQTRAFSLQGIKDLYETIQKIQRKANQRLRLLGAVLNQYEGQKALAGLAEGVKKYFPVFETVIQRRESIPQAQAKMSLLSKIDLTTMKNFRELATEVKGKIYVEKN